MWNKILRVILIGVVIILAFIVYDYTIDSPNKWINRSLYVIVGIFVLYVQQKQSKRND